MKYICLGYIEPEKFEGMSEDERHAVLDESFEQNGHLRWYYIQTSLVFS